MADNETVFDEKLSPLVETFSIDLYSPNTTYNCSIYVTTEIGDGPSSDYVTVTTTDGEYIASLYHFTWNALYYVNTDVNYLVVLPFVTIEDTYNFEVVTLPETDDEGSGAISIPQSISFPFGDTSFTTVYVSVQCSQSIHISLSILSLS